MFPPGSLIGMAGFGLDDDFLAMDDETASPPLKQTRSLGRKQCAAHWLPELVEEQGPQVLAQDCCHQRKDLRQRK